MNQYETYQVLMWVIGGLQAVNQTSNRMMILFELDESRIEAGDGSTSGIDTEYVLGNSSDVKSERYRLIKEMTTVKWGIIIWMVTIWKMMSYLRWSKCRSFLATAY